MAKELLSRIDKIKVEIENISKLPETIAIKKGQLMENTSTTENEKQSLSNQLAQAEVKSQFGFMPSHMQTRNTCCLF